MDLQNNNSQSEISELKELIEKNIKLSEEVLEISKKINGFVFWQRIFGVLKILIIFIPLILGAIFLPPLLKDVFNSYKELLGLGDTVNLDSLKNMNNSSALDNLPAGTMDKIPDSVKKYLK
ncbi:MAG: hypothetical protein US83_C0007G0036 [Candidatus Falkowbacteria bacterium GW2011_GWC2_38_22]|uniref:Uncharacterized protein n=1 Tax=Candidatus Falkowbacteria bacterium GW2011_GWE1_38_31 TaxID=1618638 RepID=A0A0G0MYC0_9BACT|nr:MAG: hypothetical protein US73_C0008G0021 [Candidatus Falkowbacteria bacterium GW2011_GWF2_38_1205]KKQ61300.1 MAG: hypothetical protein US83_C0007G0036 [Candidatus Falkowbacteria bacterium GW2011_GWC2_38_22]KKQ63128.1 MAG: hypothetical protein US84_C0008G0021 [Candidatus Falkowbacteria bacterium GW2011_GWF1_38_22]KKQ65325.1 MAG: hypothetical protein US87_C0008G0021 [Candidatus Falkowbacteria bacterium GW2011_GWE2_38_254]KKQ69901.1 MAG: hypothetical protein US91_C0008G0021 [Candidatus Falkowb